MSDETKNLLVPFVTECCFCGNTLHVEFVQRPCNKKDIELLEKYGKLISHGACPTCAKIELNKAKETLKCSN